MEHAGACGSCVVDVAPDHRLRPDWNHHCFHDGFSPKKHYSRITTKGGQPNFLTGRLEGWGERFVLLPGKVLDPYGVRLLFPTDQVPPFAIHETQKLDEHCC